MPCKAFEIFTLYLRDEDTYIQYLQKLKSDFIAKINLVTIDYTSFTHINYHFMLCVPIAQFTSAIEQLLELHIAFRKRLEVLNEAWNYSSQRNEDDATHVTTLTRLLDEMLTVLRIVYGQLFCHSDLIQRTIEAASRHLSQHTNNQSICDHCVLESLCKATEWSLDEIISRPLEHFNAVVEIVEHLSSAVDDMSDSPHAQTLMESTETQLLCHREFQRVSQESRKYIEQVQASFRLEQETRVLYSQFEGNVDLTNCKLISNDECLVTLISTGSLTTERLEAHAFDNGLLVLSQTSESAVDASRTKRTLWRQYILNSEDVLVETLPMSVHQLLSTQENNDWHPLFIAIKDEIIIIMVENEITRNQWLALQKPQTDEGHNPVIRTLDATQLLPVVFMSAMLEHDQHMKLGPVSKIELPPVKSEPGRNFFMSTKSTSTAVTLAALEIVLFRSYLIVFQMKGVASHAFLFGVNLASSNISVGLENGQSSNEWEVCLSWDANTKVYRADTIDQDSSKNIVLTTAKYNRAKHWVDLISNAITCFQQAAKMEVNSEKSESETDLLEDMPLINVNSRKRKHDLFSSESKYKMENEHILQSTDTSVANVADIKNRVHPSSQGSESSSHSTIYSASDENQPIDTKNSVAKRAKTEPRASQTSSTNITPSQHYVQVARILLTGIELTPTWKKSISAMGSAAVIEENVDSATHVVAPEGKLKRTVKLLCGISLCDYILSERWLVDSAKARTLLPEEQYLLYDEEAEKKWDFSLKQTLQMQTKSQRSQLFNGIRFVLPPHESLRPPLMDLQKIITCAGGAIVLPNSMEENDVVITTEAAIASAKVKKLLKDKKNRLYTSELILSGILRQVIDWDKHQLHRPNKGKDSAIVSPSSTKVERKPKKQSNRKR